MYSEFGPQRVSSTLATCPDGEYYRLGAGCTKRLTCPDGEYFDMMEARCAKKSADASYVPRYTRAPLWSAQGKMLAGQGRFIPVVTTGGARPSVQQMVDASMQRRRRAPVRRRAAPVRYVVVKRKPAARKRVVKKRKAVRRRR